MNPHDLGRKYDKIANWWSEHHRDSSYGIDQLQRAIMYVRKKTKALDVGCGAGGRLINLLHTHGFAITGLDVSKAMIALARQQHPEHTFIHDDICHWNTKERFDMIIGWDSLFHIPLKQQQSVIEKLCQLLSKDGVLIYTLGDGSGEHVDKWHEDNFYYSSLGINKNIELLMVNELSLLHVELDQYPEKHVYVIAQKRT